MLDIRFNKRTIRGSMARQLLKLASKIPDINSHQEVHFGRVFTTHLSDDFRYPKNIRTQWLNHDHARSEVIWMKGETPKNTIIQLHGGAYVSGYSDTYRRSAIHYLKTIDDCQVFSLDYRLAPQHPFPAALMDAVSLYTSLLERGIPANRIIIVGDSAGGGLALALGIYLRDNQITMPSSIVTMSAWTDLTMSGESHLLNQSLDPLLGSQTTPIDVQAYAKPDELQHPYVSPSFGNYHDFVDLMMHVGSHEILLSDTITVAKKASDAGNHVQVTVYRGMFHVFQLAFGLIPDAKKAWREIARFINHKFQQ